jgi:serine/threonine protein kinase
MNFLSVELTYIRTFAIQILNALAYLKEIKVIHSDLKP